MRILPVLDLRAGLAVHAIAGHRAAYQPLRSILHAGPEPLGLALAYRDRLGLTELYLADLDAIAGISDHGTLFPTLTRHGLALWVDAGLRSREGVGALIAAGVSVIVVGLETVLGSEALAGIVASAGAERLAFSLDLRAGRPHVAPGAVWSADDPLGLAFEAIRLGLRRLIVLDLARVGTARGVGSLPLVADLARAFPEVEILVGGGISGPEDLPALARAGASGALVGSALHEGQIGREHLAQLAARAAEESLPTFESPEASCLRRLNSRPSWV
jgi:phosphoribosylformimino-5-aminoimidazole carboxamide ribotide isomerase